MVTTTKVINCVACPNFIAFYSSCVKSNIGPEFYTMQPALNEFSKQTRQRKPKGFMKATFIYDSLIYTQFGKIK